MRPTRNRHIIRVSRGGKRRLHTSCGGLKEDADKSAEHWRALGYEVETETVAENYEDDEWAFDLLRRIDDSTYGTAEFDALMDEVSEILEASCLTPPPPTKETA